MVIKESWEITYSDRLSSIVYTEEIMRNAVNGRTNPRFVAGGTVTGVQYVIHEWQGSWDTRPITREVTEIYRATVDLSAITERK